MVVTPQEHKPEKAGSGRTKSLLFTVVWLLLLFAVSFLTQTAIHVLFQYQEAIGHTSTPLVILASHGLATVLVAFFSFRMAKRRHFSIVLFRSDTAVREIIACVGYSLGGAAMITGHYYLYLDWLGGSPGYQGQRPIAITITLDLK